MKITICASVDFSPKIIEIKKALEEMGHSVEIPFFTQKIIDGKISFDEYVSRKERDGGDILMRQSTDNDMVRRYWNLIKGSDAILVLNLRKKEIDNYIGGSVLMEMGFAYGFGKKIFLYNSLPAKTERVHYLDEIIDLKPIIINGDLALIE